MKQFIRTTTRLGLRLFLIAGLLAGALAVSGTTTIASASGPAIVIDDFNTGAFSVSGPDGIAMNIVAPGAIGGVRDILISDNDTATVPSVMSLTPEDGYLNLAVGNLPGNYQIGWGTLIFSGGSPLNLNISSYDRVVVTLSQAPSSGVMTVYFNSPFDFNSSHASLPLSGAGDYTFLFSSFFSLDPSDIDGIQIGLDQGVSASSTVRFESIVISSAPCPAGQYDNGSGCVNADPGYYVPVAGATEQTPCALGFYQPNAGSVSCITAEAGHYVDVTAAAMQIDCLPGSYQPNTGATSCILASPNYYVPVSAAIEQIPCPVGTTSEAGATECTLAPDTTAPTITLTTPVNGATYLLNQAIIANYACQDEVGGSGLASCAGTVAIGSAIDTASVGAKSFTVNAVDNAGNPTSATISYNVVYSFSGFSSPLDIAPTLNVAKAGQSIPLKWRITDASGVPVTNLSGVSVTVASLLCSLGTTTDALEEYASGDSGLQNLGDGYYQFNWKTPKTYANSCKTLKLNLGEGSGFEHPALFKFTK